MTVTHLQRRYILGTFVNSVFRKVSQHYDNFALLFPDHSPKIGYCGFGRRLASNVVFRGIFWPLSNKRISNWNSFVALFVAARCRFHFAHPNVTRVYVFGEWIVIDPLQGHSSLWKRYPICVSVLDLRTGRQLLYFRVNLRNAHKLFSDSIGVTAKARQPGKVQRVRGSDALQKLYLLARKLHTEHAIELSTYGILERWVSIAALRRSHNGLVTSDAIVSWNAIQTIGV